MRVQLSNHMHIHRRHGQLIVPGVYSRVRVVRSLDAPRIDLGPVVDQHVHHVLLKEAAQDHELIERLLVDEVDPRSDVLDRWSA